MNDLTDKQRAVYDAFKKHGRSRPDFIAKQMWFTESAYIYGGIKALVRKEYLKRCDGEGLKHVHYKIIK